MYKVRIDLIARRSVVIALNDADGASDAYEKAIDYAMHHNEQTPEWTVDDFESDIHDEEAINEEDILTCNTCHRQFVDTGDGICPDCQLTPEGTLLNALFGKDEADDLPPIPDEDARVERMSKKWDELLAKNKPSED